jgi:hypothetical protein
MKKSIPVLPFLFVLSLSLCAQKGMIATPGPGAFPLATNNNAAAIYTDAGDDWLVNKAAALLQQDIQQVTGKLPALYTTTPKTGKYIIIIGTVGKSALIDQLVATRKITIDSIANKWEAYGIQLVNRPFAGIEQALVITGSDRRGTAYGVFTLSAQIGVSPWYWWADVPVKKRAAIYIRKGTVQTSAPAVKYRGIFINDEAPALSGWTKEKFGGFNHVFYEKVFELLLRLKGNYLWPAMWGNAFYDDDSLNMRTADQYGIVIGTSHHEPLMRAHDEWRRYGKGKWNYDSNEVQLKAFWKAGMQRAGNEKIVSIGMRGDGDEPMSRETATALLERIVKDQRNIISEVTQRPAAETPQLWALYKEVQDYYDKGMRVPDDVTLLLCDDNWGNIRKLPRLNEKPRAGGYGIYYHFDYVGGPRNYKWLNTNPITRVWEQMHLAYAYGADRIWIVNVGDIKPMEFPIHFFLDYAWAPASIGAGDLQRYTEEWATQQFPQPQAKKIASIISEYTKFNGRRKPELLAPETYSLHNYREAETVVNDYNHLLADAEAINRQLPVAYRDAYFQLVLHPVQACANLNELYVTVAKNRLYAVQGRAITNELADQAKQLYINDSLISVHYNKGMVNGKWNHMMDQTHIGYTYWQQPPRNKMPEVKYINVPAKAAMGVAIEGSSAWWPQDTTDARLPDFYSSLQKDYYIDIFNRGSTPFTYAITSPHTPWMKFTSTGGTISRQERIWVSVDWPKLGNSSAGYAAINIRSSTGDSVVVTAVAFQVPQPTTRFVEDNGVVAMEAAHFTKAVDANGIAWKVLPHHGRTASAVTPWPVTAPDQKPGANSPHLQYDFTTIHSGKVKVNAFFSPTLNFHNNEGLQYAVSMDDEAPQIITINKDDNNARTWEGWVANNILIKASQHTIDKPGKHVLRYWMVTPGVVLQKLVVDLGGVKQSYLGPVETKKYGLRE